MAKKTEPAVGLGFGIVAIVINVNTALGSAVSSSNVNATATVPAATIGETGHHPIGPELHRVHRVLA